MHASVFRSLVGLFCVAATPCLAASGSHLCAIGEVYECLAVTGCKRVALKDINLPPMINIDLDKKQLASAGPGERTEDIEGITASDKAVFLYGTQDEETWNATIALDTGAFTGGISSGGSSFALFGNCIKK